MDMDEEKMKRLQAEMAQLSNEEKDQLRKTKEKEIEELLDFENRFSTIKYLKIFNNLIKGQRKKARTRR